MNDLEPSHLRILVVADEQVILDTYQQALFSEKDHQVIDALERPLTEQKETRKTSLSWDLVLCRQGDKAIDTITRSLDEEKPFAVAFLYIHPAPVPDRIHIAKRIRDLDSHIEIVLITGYSDIHRRNIADQIPPAHKLLYLQRPLHLQEIPLFVSVLGSKWSMEDELLNANKQLVELSKQIDKGTQLTKSNERLRQKIAERKRVDKSLLQRNQELALLNRVGHMFNSTIELNQVLATVLEEMRRLLNIVATSFWLVAPDTGELVCRQAVGPRSETLIGWRLVLGQGIMGQAAQTGETIYVKDSRIDTHHYKQVDQKTGIELRSILSIPFRAKGNVIGVLGLVDTKANRFTKEDLRLVESIATAAAGAVENAHLYMTAQQEIAERKRAEAELKAYRNQLEDIVVERTAKLITTNTQLHREITEHKKTAEALQESEERHRIVLESVPDPVAVYDMEGKVTYLNPAFSRVFGWTISESRGRTIDFIPAEKLYEAKLIFEKITHGEIVSGIETYRLTKDGTRVEVSISGAGFFDHYGTLQGSVITIQDITERKKTEEEIKFLAYHDVLTGLPNRKSFYMYLEDKMMQSLSQLGDRRRITSPKWALLFLDLDKFKNVNDTLGHDIGDELLKAVASRLQHCVRRSDHIFRLGGDEFTILLSDLNDDTDVAKVARKIRENIAQPCPIGDYVLHITTSIGISVYPNDGKDVETLVKNADMAMYAAKGEREGYRFFTEEMNQKALERMKLESSLRTALQDNQFVLYYQPLVGDRNHIIGMEALLRWYHPELGIISPIKFIPLAEETGAIISIGKWVLHTACQQARQWQEMGYTELYVSVNLSTRQFKESDLVETIEQVLDATGLAPECLKLEVTESGIMENQEQAITKMKLLRAKGICFSIDDFGTGYSSLSYLKRFPIDVLKIDRSFVMDSMENKDDQEIIKTIIAMAQTLSIEAVAEGVETKEQQDFLSLNGCHIMQGYYFGHPMPANKFEEILTKDGT